jgi:hypothetical protein
MSNQSYANMYVKALHVPEPERKLVLFMLAETMDDDARCHPSASVANNASMDRERFGDVIALLIADGLVAFHAEERRYSIAGFEDFRDEMMGYTKAFHQLHQRVKRAQA